MAGLKNQVAGKAREIKGKLTDDKTEEMAGKAQHTRGKIEAGLGRAKGKVVGKAEELKGKARQALS